MLIELAKYDGRTDYLLWERQMKGVLRASGLGKILTHLPNAVNEEDWKEMQEMAIHTVFQNLQPHVIKDIDEHFESCAELFEALAEQFHRNDLSNRLYTSWKLMNFRMKDIGVKIMDHINAFNAIVVDLKNLGEFLSDEQKALHLLGSLSASYRSLSRTLLHRDKKTITYDEVVRALLVEELQQKLAVSCVPFSSSVDTTLVSTVLPMNQGRSRERTTPISSPASVLPVNRGRPRDRTIGSNSRSKYRSPTSGLYLRKHDGSRPHSLVKTLTCRQCGKLGHIKKQDYCNEQTAPSWASIASAEDEEDLLVDYFGSVTESVFQESSTGKKSIEYADEVCNTKQDQDSTSTSHI